MAQTDGYMIERAALCSILEDMEAQACNGTENDGSDGTTRVEYPVPITTSEMLDLIAAQPAVELVRCKGCEHWKAEEGQPAGKCCYFSRDDLSDFIKAITYMTGPDDFCSMATRRGTNGNDIRG